MAIKWGEFKAHYEHYKKILPDDEPIVLPRRESARRVANKEKRTRVQFDCDEETYRAFHAQLKRYRELVVNVTMAHNLMVDILKAMPDKAILRMVEAGDQHAESLGDA